MRVRWRLTKARHVAISLEVVEWSEQLRSVTSVWLGAARRSVSSPTLHQRVYEREMFGVISPPRDLLPLIIVIIIIVIIIIIIIKQPSRRQKT